MGSILHLRSTGSTNDDAFKLAVKGAGHGFTVLADKQITGKGRLGKDWISPTGSGLYCSIIIRPKLPFSEFSKFTLTAGLALCTTVEKLLPGHPFGLKWPNDLHCHGRKCGGILVESSAANSPKNDSFIVVGIGLNINTQLSEFPHNLQSKVTSLRILSKVDYSIKLVYERVHTALLEHVKIHETKGFKSILQEWRKRDVLYGEQMEWVTSDREVVTVRGMGPDEDGKLRAKDQYGKVYDILSGDVQLVR